MEKYNVTNYTKDTSFYFDITKIYPCIVDIKNIEDLSPDTEEIRFLKEKINEGRIIINQKNLKNKIINILPKFKDHLERMQKFDVSKTKYALKIKKIIDEERQETNKAITLSKIQEKYKEKYKSYISLTTISRILRNHLNLHFRRNKLRNRNLNKNNYQFMKILFIKALLRGIK